MMFFKWRDTPITDIEAWAHDRGEAMVQFHAERDLPMVIEGEIIWIKETDDGEMPEHFWNHLRIDNGWHYREVARRKV